MQRPFVRNSYVYEPEAAYLPPASSAGTGPYGDLTNPAYYGKNPYMEGWTAGPPPRAYTFE